MATLRDTTKTFIAKRCTALTAAQQLDLEQGIFNQSLEEAKTRYVRRIWDNPDFQIVYGMVAKRTLSNLDPSSYIHNPRLLERLLEGEFLPHDVPAMTFSELYPEQWRIMIDKAMKREAKMLEVDKSVATTLFFCTRCKKRECTYYEMQTRSADEPMTQFVRCLNCDKRWKQ